MEHPGRAGALWIPAFVGMTVGVGYGAAAARRRLRDTSCEAAARRRLRDASCEAAARRRLRDASCEAARCEAAGW
ncbi:MAG: hypothetical protein OXG69_08705 [bacterium]|nr:hypothetical protein [bacterium]